MWAFAIEPMPTLAALLAALPREGRFCLDGTAEHREGRFSFAGASPRRVIAIERGSPAPLVAVGRHLADAGTGATDWAGDDPPPFTPGAAPRDVVAIAYDAAWSDPRAVSLRTPPRIERGDGPVALLARYDAMVALDLVERRAWAIAEDEAAARALQRAVLDAIGPPSTARPTVGDVLVEEPARHLARIERALEAIAAGDLYQVNLARPWRVPYVGSPLALWERMRDASAVPLGLYLELDARAIVARTMERFLAWDRAAGRLSTSPIKGTIARGGADREEADALLRDDKERAEHSMIVDLMRNDLSRVAETGSVRVRDALRVEPFARLHHLVSTVECEVRPDADAGAILAATFPPGSVTGAPKLRAMELIETLEDTPRGFYTGALGYADRAGGLSLAVAIRTAVIERGEARYFAGGGIVSASDPARELAETELKARVFLDAIRALQR
ncbi:MAG: anthranilate synthase component I family protein [Sandaracinaceae bacterium]